jgi:hypothetical protein
MPQVRLIHKYTNLKDLAFNCLAVLGIHFSFGINDQLGPLLPATLRVATVISDTTVSRTHNTAPGLQNTFTTLAQNVQAATSPINMASTQGKDHAAWQARAGVRAEIEKLLKQYNRCPEKEPPFTRGEMITMAVLCSHTHDVSMKDIVRWIVGLSHTIATELWTTSF